MMNEKTNYDLSGHVSGQANKPLSSPAHALSYQQVVDDINADLKDGLKNTEAKKRLEEYGPNEISYSGGVSPGKILLRQFANSMTLVLVLAMAVSFGIESWIEGGVIAGVIVVNVVVGFVQEFGAEKTMDSLRSLSSPTATVVRDGKAVTIPTREVVPGDMVELKTGDTIPADVRLVEAVNFETDEALLTGESAPVEKNAKLHLEPSTGPGDRLNVAFSSSTVTKGRARAIVFATSMYTEIGAIAAALRTEGSKKRPVKKKPDGSAGPHRYAQAWSLTATDAVGRFLGVKNVGTPLQRKLARLALLLLGVAVICAIIVLAANRFAQYPEIIAENPNANPTQEVAIYAVATGLSMIPACLIVVLTISMAAGTKVMVQRNVIVRKLNALEALGGVTDICSDKTGTLTQGKMVANMAWVPAKGTYSVGESREPLNPNIGSLHFSSDAPSKLTDDEYRKTKAHSYRELLQNNFGLLEYLKAASLANLANAHETEGEWRARGDPTEVAIQVFATRFDWNRNTKLDGPSAEWIQIAEYPFDSSLKKMSVIVNERSSGESFVFSKGAVERVLESCTQIQEDVSEASPITDGVRRQIVENTEAIASRGLRCLALASKSYKAKVDASTPPERSNVESCLTFRGLIGLYDPPRPESEEAVRKCHSAGITVHMLTGDHAGTARAIAGQVGILPARMKRVSKHRAKEMVMSAGDFDSLSDDQVDQLSTLPLVIARCTPNTKVRMIEALHRRGKYCAMTGDGINDSPSLKRADIGIAMGESGSDVAKDASDIILTDDNFASILNAIEEGRRMFDNIQKFVLHLLSENIAQAFVLLVGLAFKDQRGLSVFPLSPVEILWLIMITSGFPDMGLGFERAAPDVMTRPPVSLQQGIFSIEVLLDMTVYGMWIAVLCLGAFSLVIYGWGDRRLGDGCNGGFEGCELVFRARGTTFACLTWFALFLGWEMVDMRRSFFRMKPGSKRYLSQWMLDVWDNKFLFWSVIAGFVTVFPILYIPIINHSVFLHTGISWEWGIVFVASGLFFLGVESWKYAKRVFFRYQSHKSNGRLDKQDIESKAMDGYLGGAGIPANADDTQKNRGLDV